MLFHSKILFDLTKKYINILPSFRIRSALRPESLRLDELFYEPPFDKSAMVYSVPFSVSGEVIVKDEPEKRNFSPKLPSLVLRYPPLLFPSLLHLHD